MVEWSDYATLNKKHTVVGTLKVAPEFYSTQLDNHRDLLVWLPPSYDASAEQRYPVIYMHDGQNLFDAETSFVGEWQVDETMTTLAADGLQAIIVGLPNNDQRVLEYNPFPDTWVGKGKGDAYLQFIVQTVKPLIDAVFRTLPGRDSTGIAGSSMGGLISLYAYFKHADVFGLCGAFSPAYWFGGSAIMDFVRDVPYAPGKLYMDIGTDEGVVAQRFPWRKGITQQEMSRRYVESVRRIRDLLREKGYADMLYVEENGAPHNEDAWARRLPAAMRYLLG